MSRWLANVWRLGLKELASLTRDVVMLLLIAYSFSFAVYSVATGEQTELRNASIAVIDGDRSALSRRIADALPPPFFQEPALIDRADAERLLDAGAFSFVLDIPPRFQSDLLAGRRPSIAISVDATAMTQAGIGTTYLSEIIAREVLVFLAGRRVDAAMPVNPPVRVLFNPNLEGMRFTAVMQVLESITMLSVILVGAAVIREREHGTIEHLLVMPVRSSEIAAAKIWANGFAVLVATGLSLVFMVQLVLGLSLPGSIPLFLAGTAMYLFASTSLGILLATVARSMPQLALLAIPVIIAMNMLSGGTTPIESMPVWLSTAMQLVPSTHFVAFAQAVLHRGADLSTVWPDLTVMMAIGAVFLAFALARFHRMLEMQG